MNPKLTKSFIHNASEPADFELIADISEVDNLTAVLFPIWDRLMPIF